MTRQEHDISERIELSRRGKGADDRADDGADDGFSDQADLPQDKLIGQIIGKKYEVMALLGAGACGKVYEVRHLDLNERMAAKVLHRHLADREKEERFRQEARVLMKLHHKNLCRVFDYGLTADGQPCIVMELLDGETLDVLLKRNGALPPARALAIAREICEALKEAHSKNVIHRDIKPSNVMVTGFVDGVPQVKLLDFGLAHVSDVGASLTATGDTLGTPAFMSPEQWRGMRLDGRTDIYSLGCVLYEMLTGVRPFETSTVHSCMHKHLSEEPPPLKTANPQAANPRLQALITGALQKDPAHRYKSADAFLADIERVEGLGHPLHTVAGKSSAETPLATVAAPTARQIWFSMCFVFVAIFAILAFTIASNRSFEPEPKMIRMKDLLKGTNPSPSQLELNDKSAMDLMGAFERAEVLVQGPLMEPLLQKMSQTSPSTHKYLVHRFSNVIKQEREHQLIRRFLQLTYADQCREITFEIMNEAFGGGQTTFPQDCLTILGHMLLSEKNNEYRRTIARSLGKTATQSVPTRELLIRALDAEADENVREPLVHGLGWSIYYENPSAESIATNRLIKVAEDDPSAKVRGAAINSLAQYPKGARRAVPVFIKMLTDPNDSYKLSSLEGLIHAGPAAAPAVPQLIKIVADKDEYNHRAIEALGAIGPAAQPAVPILLKALDDRDTSEAAAQALAEIGKPAAAALPKMLSLLKSPNGAKREAAAKMIASLGSAGKQYIPQLKEACITWNDAGNYNSILEAIKELGGDIQYEEVEAERKKRGIK